VGPSREAGPIPIASARAQDSAPRAFRLVWELAGCDLTRQNREVVALVIGAIVEVLAIEVRDAASRLEATAIHGTGGIRANDPAAVGAYVDREAAEAVGLTDSRATRVTQQPLVALAVAVAFQDAHAASTHSVREQAWATGNAVLRIWIPADAREKDPALVAGAWTSIAAVEIEGAASLLDAFGIRVAGSQLNQTAAERADVGRIEATTVGANVLGARVSVAAVSVSLAVTGGTARRLTCPVISTDVAAAECPAQLSFDHGILARVLDALVAGALVAVIAVTVVRTSEFAVFRSAYAFGVTFVVVEDAAAVRTFSGGVDAHVVLTGISGALVVVFAVRITAEDTVALSWRLTHTGLAADALSSEEEPATGGAYIRNVTANAGVAGVLRAFVSVVAVSVGRADADRIRVTATDATVAALGACVLTNPVHAAVRGALVEVLALRIDLAAWIYAESALANLA
jgi:hypothetical protein